MYPYHFILLNDGWYCIKFRHVIHRYIIRATVFIGYTPLTVTVTCWLYSSCAIHPQLILYPTVCSPAPPPQSSPSPCTLVTNSCSLCLPVCFLWGIVISLLYFLDASRCKSSHSFGLFSVWLISLSMIGPWYFKATGSSVELPVETSQQNHITMEKKAFSYFVS